MSIPGKQADDHHQDDHHRDDRKDDLLGAHPALFSFSLVFFLLRHGS